MATLTNEQLGEFQDLFLLGFKLAEDAATRERFMKGLLCVRALPRNSEIVLVFDQEEQCVHGRDSQKPHVTIEHQAKLRALWHMLDRARQAPGKTYEQHVGEFIETEAPLERQVDNLRKWIERAIGWLEERNLIVASEDPDQSEVLVLKRCFSYRRKSEGVIAVSVQDIAIRTRQ